MIDAFPDPTPAKPNVYDEYAAARVTLLVPAQARERRDFHSSRFTQSLNWPSCWFDSKSVERFWSTVKIHSFTSATGKFGKLGCGAGLGRAEQVRFLVDSLHMEPPQPR